jgi:hypothetical protein
MRKECVGQKQFVRIRLGIPQGPGNDDFTLDLESQTTGPKTDGVNDEELRGGRNSGSKKR